MHVFARQINRREPPTAVGALERDLEFPGRCLRAGEGELDDHLRIGHNAAEEFDADPAKALPLLAEGLAFRSGRGRSFGGLPIGEPRVEITALHGFHGVEGGAFGIGDERRIRLPLAYFDRRPVQQNVKTENGFGSRARRAGAQACPEKARRAETEKVGKFHGDGGDSRGRLTPFPSDGPARELTVVA